MNKNWRLSGRFKRFPVIYEENWTFKKVALGAVICGLVCLVFWFISLLSFPCLFL